MTYTKKLVKAGHFLRNVRFEDPSTVAWALLWEIFTDVSSGLKGSLWPLGAAGLDVVGDPPCSGRNSAVGFNPPAIKSQPRNYKNH